MNFWKTLKFNFKHDSFQNNTHIGEWIIKSLLSKNPGKIMFYLPSNVQYVHYSLLCYFDAGEPLTT